MAQVRKDSRKEIRQMELDGISEFFTEHIRQFARPSEENAFDNLIRTAKRSIERNDNDFESHLRELKGRNFEILWRKDWFVIELFKRMVLVATRVLVSSSIQGVGSNGDEVSPER